MIQIKPILVGLPSKEANFIMIRPLINSTQSLNCNTYYEVISKVTTFVAGAEGGEDTESSTSEVLTTGNYPISEEDYAAWSQDNSFIEDIVLAGLGLERA